jgi:hypothetical protein
LKRDPSRGWGFRKYFLKSCEPIIVVFEDCIYAIGIGVFVKGRCTNGEGHCETVRRDSLKVENCPLGLGAAKVQIRGRRSAEVVVAVVDLLCDIQSTILCNLGVADITSRELDEIVISCKSISTFSCRRLRPDLEGKFMQESSCNEETVVPANRGNGNGLALNEQHALLSYLLLLFPFPTASSHCTYGLRSRIRSLHQVSLLALLLALTTNTMARQKQQTRKTHVKLEALCLKHFSTKTCLGMSPHPHCLNKADLISAHTLLSLIPPSTTDATIPPGVTAKKKSLSNAL